MPSRAAEQVEESATVEVEAVEEVVVVKKTRRKTKATS
jgi:hypothetical protein